MLDFTTQILIFLRVVEEGRFSGAARSLGISTSAVSKQVRRLEDHLGIRLLNRNTRGISLTGEGEVYFREARGLAGQLQDLESLAMSLGDTVRGPLRVCSTVAFAKTWLLPQVRDFLQRYPDINIEFELTDSPVDFLQQNVDVAIRFSEQVHDTSVVARRLAVNRRVVCAAPAYLDRHGTPEHPDDLERHNCLRLSTVNRWNEWRFDRDGQSRVLRVTGNFRSNDADAIYHATLEGLGIARLSTYIVADDIASGRLVRLLPDYVDMSSNLLAVYPDRRNLPRKVSVFIDYLMERFQPVPPWESTPELKKIA